MTGTCPPAATESAPGVVMAPGAGSPAHGAEEYDAGWLAATRGVPIRWGDNQPDAWRDGYRACIDDWAERQRIASQRG